MCYTCECACICVYSEESKDRPERREIPGILYKQRKHLVKAAVTRYPPLHFSFIFLANLD